jgi:hypothetical protein
MLTWKLVIAVDSAVTTTITSSTSTPVAFAAT